MKVKTEIDEHIPSQGYWPWNMVLDINTACGLMTEKGFCGTPITVVWSNNINNCLHTLLRDSDVSFGEFICRNKIIDDIHVVRFNEIDLKKDSVLIITHEIDFSKYPDIGMGLFIVEITDIMVSN